MSDVAGHELHGSRVGAWPPGDLVNFSARAFPMPREIKQFAYILDGKAKFPRPPDEG